MWGLSHTSFGSHYATDSGHCAWGPCTSYAYITCETHLHPTGLEQHSTQLWSEKWGEEVGCCTKELCCERASNKRESLLFFSGAPMSELFDLLRFDTPTSQRDVTDSAGKHPSLSPSPRGRIAWGESQPSSSPKCTGGSAPLLAPATPAKLLPDNLFLDKENQVLAQDIQKSPSAIRRTRVRRRSRTPLPTPYTYNMCAIVPPVTSSARSDYEPRKPLRKRHKVHGITRIESDLGQDRIPTPKSQNLPPCAMDKKNCEHPQPSSDDSFSRVLDEDFPIDAYALEQIAAQQGW